MNIAVIQFPGSNADWDSLHAARDVLGANARFVFHKETELGQADALIIPGGFSFGDYLRPGAIAGFSAITASIQKFAKAGGPVLGICNGFQVLTEIGLLPGALCRNAHLRFECKDVFVRKEGEGVFTNLDDSVLRVPIAHADGRYHCDASTLAQLEREGRVAFRYCEADGSITDASNPNGSISNIAGIYSEKKNVLGMMPHPERASEKILGNEDGYQIFKSLKAHLKQVA